MFLPVAASSGLDEALTDLLVVLVAAQVGAEIFKRLNQPTLVGQILGGVAIGPSVLNWVGPTEQLEIFSELGVVFLLFWVGLKTKVEDLRAVGRVGIVVGLSCAALPFVSGYGLGLGLDREGTVGLFLGAALVSTSMGITAAVLQERGVLQTRAGRTVLAAGVVDDILAMILLAIAVGVNDRGGVDIGDVITITVLAVGFVATFMLAGTAFMRRRPRILTTLRFSNSPLLPAVIICLACAVLASQIGLAAIIGAFLAGLMIGETASETPIEQEIAPLHAFFPPFFFAFIGLSVNLGALFDARSLLLLGLLTAVAIASKYLGVLMSAKSLDKAETKIVAVGMIPRGEVGILVAGIALTAEVIGQEGFAVIVGMSVLTTLVVPPLLRSATGRPNGSIEEENAKRIIEAEPW